MANDARLRMSYEAFARAAAPVQGALAALGKAVDDAGLDKAFTELIKLRASQINGCAFCLQLHLNIARKLGVPGEKLDLVGVWRETDVFSPRERAALAWTEALTDLSDEAARAAAAAALPEHFTPDEILFLTVAIGTINQWNRIAIGLSFPPPVPKRAAPGPA
ncbi:AhpD family alkylhydroperoxidase [Roseiarcus fermentans]|uniref:AhpD family alkylhydroperoxidase n=1 Tax=Roseiarcus fermentans TaxID=1473586 RepID=A0A366F5M7_9HYPH|nr:carboxymuconolactone decarboxylase family protein [Roseiarcus fermentans]RBP09069.1 AhpD family alkylhydroperoxidase [Roseiarcus fermentans]